MLLLHHHPTMCHPPPLTLCFHAQDAMHLAKPHHSLYYCPLDRPHFQGSAVSQAGLDPGSPCPNIGSRCQSSAMRKWEQGSPCGLQGPCDGPLPAGLRRSHGTDLEDGLPNSVSASFQHCYNTWGLPSLNSPPLAVMHPTFLTASSTFSGAPQHSWMLLQTQCNPRFSAATPHF